MPSILANIASDGFLVIITFIIIIIIMIYMCNDICEKGWICYFTFKPLVSDL